MIWLQILTLLGGGYYTLRDVIFYLENADCQVSEYRIKANAKGITAVTIQDTNNLKMYLQGTIDMCEQIDTSMNGEIISSSLSKGSSDTASGPRMTVEQSENERKQFCAVLDETLGMIVPSVPSG